MAVGASRPERRDPRPCRLRHLHLRLDRAAQGGRQYPPGYREPPALDAAGVRAHAGGQRPAKDAVQLRRLGLGVLLAAARRRPPGRRPAGRTPGAGIYRRHHRRARDHDGALRSSDVAGLPRGEGAGALHVSPAGDRQRRSPRPGAREAVLVASWPAAGSRAVQPLRTDGSCGGRDLVHLPAGRRASSDRAAGREYAPPPARCPGLHRPARGARGAPHRRRPSGPRIRPPARADRGTLRTGPVRRAGSAAVPDRRSRASPPGRGDRVSGTDRSPGQDPGLPGRARGDRGGLDRPSGDPRGGRAGAWRRRRPAARGLCRRGAGAGAGWRRPPGAGPFVP